MGAAWVSTKEAAEHLGVSPSTLLKVAKASPIRVPWSFSGWVRRTYRWRFAGLDVWFAEVAEWHRSKSVENVGLSDGATQTGRVGSAPARHGRRPTSSSGTSLPLSSSDSDGSLVQLAKRLTCER